MSTSANLPQRGLIMGIGPNLTGLIYDGEWKFVQVILESG